MSKVTERTSFTIPPCIVDKDLIKKIGEVLEKEYEVFYKELFDETKKRMQEKEYYKKYPQELTEKDIRSEMLGTEPRYSLISNSKNIESSNIDAFIQTEWPDSASEISVEFGSTRYAKRASVTLYLERWRMKNSEVIVSGENSTWVNGVAVKLEQIFESKKLSYHPLVTHASLRFILSIAACFHCHSRFLVLCGLMCSLS